MYGSVSDDDFDSLEDYDEDDDEFEFEEVEPEVEEEFDEDYCEECGNNLDECDCDLW